MKIAVLGLGLLLLAGCENQAGQPAEQTGHQTAGPSTTGDAKADRASPTKPEPAEAVKRPTDAELALRRLDRRLEDRKLYARTRKGWVTADELASTYLSRARLTGDLEDFVQAGEALKLAFERAKPGDGPFFTRAYYNTAIGRTDLVQPDIKAEQARTDIRRPTQASDFLGLLGDGAMHSGELKSARVFYQRALDRKATIDSLARVSFFDARSGMLDAAKTGYENALELAGDDSGRRAWVLVQRGSLDLLVDDPESALGWFAQAEEVFSGWYVTAEYTARATLRSGETEKACVMFETLAQSHPDGRYRAAAASCRGKLGDTAARDKWRAEARAAFERDLQRLPGLVRLDAVEFYLDVQPKRALKLAKEGMKYGAGPETRRQLAQAYLATGKPKKAREVLEPLREQGWAEPAFLATLALAHEGTKDGEKYAGMASPTRLAELRERLGLK